MKSNSPLSGTLIFSTIVMSLCIVYSSPTLADNKAALKDAIGFSSKVADARPIQKVDIVKPIATNLIPALEKEFEQLDDDKNEKLTLLEAAKDQNLVKEFNVIDINHDRLLSTDEFTYYKTVVASTKTNPESMSATFTN
jgi:hypothetical protein